MLEEDSDDDEMTNNGQRRIGKLKKLKRTIRRRDQDLAFTYDPNDDKNIMIEIQMLPVGMKRACLRAIYSRCIASMLNIKAGISKLSTRL